MLMVYVNADLGCCKDHLLRPLVHILSCWGWGWGGVYPLRSRLTQEDIDTRGEKPPSETAAQRGLARFHSTSATLLWPRKGICMVL